MITPIYQIDAFTNRRFAGNPARMRLISGRLAAATRISDTRPRERRRSVHRIWWHVTVIAVLICFCGAGSAQKKPSLPGITGDFAGMLDQYHVRLDLQEDASGRLTGTLYNTRLVFQKSSCGTQVATPCQCTFRARNTLESHIGDNV